MASRDSIERAEHIQQGYGSALTPEQRTRFDTGGISGVELVDGTARLAAMNLLLHGIGKPNGPSLIEVRDALAEQPKSYPSVVLANPPFGKKSSITVIAENGGTANREDIEYNRQDFWVTTKNKQLNFVQHIASMLGIPGRAAIVVPDSVLFEGWRRGNRPEAAAAAAGSAGRALDVEAVGVRPALLPARRARCHRQRDRRGSRGGTEREQQNLFAE